MKGTRDYNNQRDTFSGEPDHPVIAKIVGRDFRLGRVMSML